MDDVLNDVLDVVDTEEPTLHQKTAPVQTEKVETKAEAPKTETKTETKTNTKTEVAEEADPAENIDEQDFSRHLSDDTDADDTTTEPSKTETPTEAETPASDDWKPSLPEAPKFLLEPPQYNEDGYITNMSPQQYETYVIEKAKFDFRQEAYVTNIENQALDAAEKLLPQIKTSPAVRTMVENARIASILNGEQINSFEAAKLVKEALGLSTKEVDAKVAQAKAQGAQNAKASITIQKNAAVETQGSTKTKADTSKNSQLTKRLKAGDDEAFAELFQQWDSDGKLS